MRHAIKLCLAAIAAGAYSLLQSKAIDLARADALAERLDPECMKLVSAYLNDTELNRAIGFGILLFMWSIGVFVIDLLVDQVFSSARRS